MAFSYPEFHGRNGESVEEFLENMEVACISNHVQTPAQMLQLLQIYLKGDARSWSRRHEKELQRAHPPVPLTWDNLRQTLATHFVKVEDLDKVWHEIEGLIQGAAEPIDNYIKKFSFLWESLCQALQPQGPPPDMMKKDIFLAGLRDTLRLKVDLKKPKTFDNAVKVARNKEWKIQRLKELGMYPSDKVRPKENMHFNFVKACDGNGHMQEPQRPKQMKPRMYYVPSNFFPKHEVVVQVKEDAKQVKQEVHVHEGLMQIDVKEVNDAYVEPCVESKALDVETMCGEDMLSLESFSVEERKVDTIQDMYAICMQENDLECSTKSSLDLDVEYMHAVEVVDLVDDARVSEEGGHEDIEYMTSLNQDSLHDLTREEGMVQTFMQVAKDVLVLTQGSLSDEEEIFLKDVQDAWTMRNLCMKLIPRGLARVHVFLEDEELKVEDLDAIKEEDLWGIASLDEEEPEVDMDASMVRCVPKATLRIHALLRTKEAMLLKNEEPTDDLKLMESNVLDEGFDLVDGMESTNENDVLLHTNLFALELDILEGHAYVIDVQGHEEIVVLSVWLKCPKRMIFLSWHMGILYAGSRLGSLYFAL